MGAKTIIWFGKYDVIRKLAEGGTSTVYLAKHMELDACRVIKRLPKASGTRQQFINEINSLKSRETSGIPIIYDVEEDKEYFYIIEEYIEGISLRAYRLNQSNISERRIIDFAIQICEVLDTLHSRKESILYCDLKPENIIVSQDKIKIVDFGASIRQFGNEKRKKSFGTKGYAAPEQYGFQRLDRRSDIFGIGAILFFLVTGEDFRGEKEDWNRLKQKRMYSSSLKKMIQKCLKHYPVERYESVGQLKKSLVALQKKEKNQQKTPYIIAVTGNQKRVGATHVAIMLTEALNCCHGPALYVETGEGRAIGQIQREVGDIKGCPMVRGEIGEILPKYPDYQFYVCDYGNLAGEAAAYEQEKAYEACDKYLVITGIKPWEAMPEGDLPENQRKKVLFLANFADGFLFSRKCPSLSRKGKWVRIPYVPDPFQVKESWLKELMEEILYDGGQEK